MNQLISVYQYAAQKGVSATAVYKRIDKGDIKPLKIGKTKYINWDHYKNLKFKHGT